MNHGIRCLGVLLLVCGFARAEFATTNYSPANGAADICPDTLLHLVFNEAVSLGSTGRLQVIRVSDDKVVDALNAAAGGWTNQYGTKLLRYEPFRIDGQTVNLQLHSHVLESGTNTTYAILIDPGVFQSATGEPLAGITNGQWQFSVRAPLAKGRTRIEVAPASHGDFCTLQGAMDYLPAKNETPLEIYIRNGTYDSVAHLGPGRNHLRIVGEDRQHTVLAGRNNDKLNLGRTNRPFVSVEANDVTMANLTIRNTTPYKGTQAEALRLEGERCVIRNCNFYSFQDTLLLNGRVYVADCFVAGDADFIWGYGTTCFENCELRALHDGYYVTARNPSDKLGFVFAHCKLTAAPEATKTWLGRIESDRFPDSAVAFINCQMGPHIPTTGWLITGNDTSHLRFFEFNSTSLGGKLLDVSQRHAAARQLSAAEAAALSDVNRVLAAHDNWRPKP